uniref:F-box domain-containing protein n=1 Tax=Acrobeloides nanus TaxID=290746 RepID=A0A914C812_9BILA
MNLENIPSPSRIPSDLLLDILQYNNRDDVDKCQYLSSYFNLIIAKSYHILPLYFLEEILLDEEQEFTATIIDSDKEHENYMEKLDLEDSYVQASMYKCIAKHLKLAVRDESRDIIQMLGKIVKNNELPLKALRCELLYTKCFDFDWLENIPIIFTNLISTEKLKLTFHAFRAFLYLAGNPKKCLPLQNPALELNIETNETWSNAEYNWLNEQGVLQRFIGGVGLDTVANREYIYFENVEQDEMDILQAFIKILRNCENPHLLFKRYRFVLYCRDEQRLHNLFTQQGYLPYKAVVGRYQNHQREDGWIIEVDFCHANRLEFAFLLPNQERIGFNE